MATKNIVPRADTEGSLGTALKRWGDIHAVLVNGGIPIYHADFTGKGALLTATAAGQPSVQSVGPDGTMLVADSSQPDGLGFAGPILNNYSVADQLANAVDTYLVGSSLAVPAGKVKVGTQFLWRIVMTKTAAGVAAPVWSLRVGTAGAVGDAARLTFTGGVQTAVVDTGFLDIIVTVRNNSAAGVIAGGLRMTHNLAATGFSLLSGQVLQAISAGFDLTVANLIFGLSVNPGASGAWTHQIVQAEARNLLV